MAICNSQAEGFEFVPGQSWEEHDKKCRALLGGLEDVSNNLGKGEIVGALVRFPAADGYAVYRVVADSPLELQLIPFGDSWQIAAPHMRGLIKEDILEMLERDQRMAKLFGSRK